MADKLMEEVDQLLAEREKYAGWLQRLESERDAVSPRAFERVHEDYTHRLEEVDRRLEAHTESIGGRLKELEGELVTVERQRTERVEDLEEARLRHSVGEYQNDAEWGELEGQLTEAVEAADEKLSAVREEMDKLRGILGQVATDEPAAAAGTARDEPAPDGRAGAPRAGGDEAADGRAAAASEPASSPEAPAAASGEDEGVGFSIEDLDAAVNGAADDVRAGEGVADEAAAGEAAAGEGEELEDELAFLESLSLDNSEELDSLMFLEEKGRGQPQTVICPQCSAANGPAEWYCTECGEELPAE